MNGHRPFSPGSGNWSKCPLTDLAGRIKEPARMCRKPIFSSPAAKIPLFDLDRVKGGSVAPGDPPKTVFGPSTIASLYFRYTMKQ